MPFAAVRVQTIKSINTLKTIEAHGMRLDEASRTRCDISRKEDSLTYSIADDPLAVVDAYKKRKSDTNAREYKNAALGIHALCVVSPEWIQEAGDMHDPKNPRNTALFEAAQAWGNKTFGAGSVVSARLDLDEAGGGVVDLVIIPVHEVRQRGKVKNQVSVNKAYEKAFGGGRVYKKMQDSWADYCQQHLDPNIQRGKPKAETQRQHVHADILRPALREAAEKNQKADERLKLASKRAAIARRNAEKMAVNEWRKRSIFSKMRRNKELLEDAEADEIYADGQASIQPKLDTALSSLGIEKSRVARLESENRKLRLDNNKLTDDMEKIETALCEFAYDDSIPMQHRHSLISKIKGVVSRPLHFLNNVAEAVGFKQKAAPPKKADVLQFNR